MAQAGFQIRFATVARIAVAIAIAGKALEPACCAGTEGRRVGAVRTYIAALLTMARIGIEIRFTTIASVSIAIGESPLAYESAIAALTRALRVSHRGAGMGTGSTMTGVGIEIRFTTVGWISVAIVKAGQTGNENTFTVKTIGYGIGEGTSASALVGNTSASAGVGRFAVSTIQRTAIGIDNAAGSPELGAGFRCAATFVGNPPAPTDVGSFAIPAE
jgi:hypothetical protein